MFKFLKDKLKGALNIFKKKVKEEVPEEEVEVEKEAAVAVPPAEEKKEEKKVEEKKVEEVKVEEKPEPAPPPPKVEEKPKVEEEPKPAPAPPKPKVEAPPKPKVEEKPKPKVEEAPPPKVVEKPPEPAKRIEVAKPTVPLEKPKVEVEAKPKKKGFFARITEKVKEKVLTKRISQDQFQKFFWELELALLENNVAVEVIEKIKSDLAQDLVDKPIPRGKIESTIETSLQNSIAGLFAYEPYDVAELIKKSGKRPFVICYLGINGSGKTTTIAKMAKLLQDKGLSVVVAAGDTFRAAAIQQLEIHANRLDVKLIKHDYGADPAAVAYDAVAHAKAANKDVVLIDTAGRLHSNVDLMDELRKIVRVAKPDLNIFVGEAIVGNDCVEQAKKFDEAVGIDGIVLTKADVDEKGGAAVSISHVTRKPILYLGTGQEYKDLTPFSAQLVMQHLGLAAEEA